MGTKILSIPSHQLSFSPSPRFTLCTWILPQPLWPFPQAFLVYLRFLSFSLTFNLYCYKASFLPINEVLLPLNSQRQSHKWGSQSFSYQTHQNCFPSIQPQKFPRDSCSLYLLLPSHSTKLYITKKGKSLTKTAAMLSSLISYPSKAWLCIRLGCKTP